ncbi:MAG: hypothetical protein EA408_07160 [Marinilabiliales bacterium]|nr:MAG: hypothetical protein EA408_07160 [Marinilabiliales bacterium]
MFSVMGVKIFWMFFITLAFLFQPSPAADDDDHGSVLAANLHSYTEHLADHKVFLHLDKSGYQTGQTIWFRAYLVDAVSHRPAAGMNNIFVELLGTDGKPMAIRLLLARDGVAKGDIRLSRNLPEGNYVLRAYSAWMRNSGEDNFFTSNLYISNPSWENMIPRIDIFRNRIFNWRLGRQESSYDVAFFPEGGNLVAGTVNRVAFRAFDGLGRGHDAKGEITDGSGNVVAVLETGVQGIGVFNLEPVAGGEYRARVSVNGDRADTYELPQLLEEGYVLRADQDEKRIRLQVFANVTAQNPLYSQELIVVGHTRGKPRYAGSHLLSEGSFEVELDRELFPSGIAHFTIFTADHIPVAERLLFVDRGDALHIAPEVGISSDGDDRFMEMSLAVTDKNGHPVEGEFSLSAVSGRSGTNGRQAGIVPYLLFSSDLEGMNGDPLVYLEQADDRADVADMLLMTYGWRRFNWDDVAAGVLPEIRYSGDPGITVAGRLRDPSKDEVISNYPVRLRIRSGHDSLYEAVTDRNGYFLFSGLFYKGEVAAELSSRRLPGNYPPEFELTLQSAGKFEYQLGVNTRRHEVVARGDNWSRDRSAGRSPYARAPVRRTAPRVYGTPDQTIYIDYETFTERTLFEVLRNRASGLYFDGNQIIIRGPSSIQGSNEARFMLDGAFVHRDAFLSMYPREVERVEIFRGTSAAIFGVRGGTGVILAYTRRPGYSGLEDVMELSMLGYHEAREFYSDRITLPGVRSGDDVEATVYWEPEIVTGEKGRAGLRLPFSEGADRLTFTIQGIGRNGLPGYSTFTLDIE